MMNGDVRNAGDDDPPPPPPQQQQEYPRPQSRFECTLQKIDRNEIDTFLVRDAVEETQEPLTLVQARDLSDALNRSTSVEKVSMDLKYCSIEAIGPLVEHIRSSPTLTEVSADYNPLQQHSESTQRSYQRELDRLYRVAGENPSIQLLRAGRLGSPEAIYHLLANTKSLTHFRNLEYWQNITEEMAKSIAEGISCNSSITTFELDASSGPLDRIVFGLIRSAVEDLTLCCRDENHAEEFWKAVSQLILRKPSLKCLDISGSESLAPQGAGKIFLDLCHPDCAGLKMLTLRYVYDEGTFASDIMHLETAPNTSLESLALDNTRFDIRLLWNVVGLQKLSIDFDFAHIEDNDDFDLEEDCATFIRRNTNLAEIHMLPLDADFFNEAMDQTVTRGVLEGARQLKVLARLKIVLGDDGEEIGLMDENTGLRLCRLLQDTPSLKELYFESVQLDRECTRHLVQGLSHNKTLRRLGFLYCTVEPRGIADILHGALANPALQDISFRNMEMEEQIGGSCAETLKTFFKSNESVVKLCLSQVDLRASTGLLSECLVGLQEDKSLKTLLFDNIIDKCSIDNEGMELLVQALVGPGALTLSEIGLPSSVGTRVFLDSLAHMPNIQKVHFGFDLTQLDDEVHGLMLHAVKENKKLLFLDGCYPRSFSSSSVTTGDWAEIDYYLKLNRFGRRTLDSPNIPTSLWPTILSPMTSQLEDADAMFYFVGQYFSRFTADLVCTAPPVHQGQQPPHQKKARIAQS